jgi:hypothetical protein
MAQAPTWASAPQKYINVILIIALIKLNYDGIIFFFDLGGALGYGTALQAETARVRLPMQSLEQSRVLFTMEYLEFFIDLILPAKLWTWNRFSL